MVHGGHWLSRAGQQQTVLVCGAAGHAHVVGQALPVDGVGVVAGLVHQGGAGSPGPSSTGASSEPVRVRPRAVVVREREGVVLGELHWEVLQYWRLAHYMAARPMEVVSIVEAEWSGSSPGVVAGRAHSSSVPLTAAPPGWVGLREHLTRLQYHSQSVSLIMYLHLHHHYTILQSYIFSSQSYGG